MLESVKSHSWNFRTPNSQLRDALDAAQWFCADMATGQKPYWLSLVGYSGTGKTHLARAITDFFKHRMMGVPYIELENVIRHRDYRFRTWSRCMGQIHRGEFGSVQDIAQEWLLVLDDIGAEHDPRKFGVSQLLDILNIRRDRWTVITSNLTLEQIGENLDVRLASRLIRDGSKVIELTCQDYNLP
jgi:DNA replication protein DnaC